MLSENNESMVSDRSDSDDDDHLVIDLMMSLTQINRRKRCVNFPRSKKGAPTNIPVSVDSHSGRSDFILRANRTSGETTVIL